MLNEVAAWILVSGAENVGLSPVLLTAGPLRLPVRRLIRGAFPQLPVIAFGETAGIGSIETVGQVSRGEFVARG